MYSRLRLVRRRLSSAIICASLIFVLSTHWSIPARAGKEVTFIPSLILFDFQTSGDIDSFFAKIKDISMWILRSELQKHPSIGKVIMERPEDMGLNPEDYDEFTRNQGLEYNVSVRFEPLREQVILTSKWSNLKLGRSGEELVLLGKEDLSDFDRIDRKMRELAKTVAFNMLQANAVTDSVEWRIQISCFRGSRGAGIPYMDRHATLALPFLLKQHLDRAKIRANIYGIAGYTENEYVRKCLKDEPVAEGKGIRYVISGTIIREGKELVVAPLLVDTVRRDTIELIHGKFDDEDIHKFPSLLASYLVEMLTILFAQERLLQEGFNPGDPDGSMGPRTAEALDEYQRKNGLPVTGKLSEATLKSLGLIM